MIAYLRGRVLAITAETAILDIGGVGYEVYCSASAFSRMTQGEQTELFTHLQVKEDGMTLFGFSSEREKQTFLKLIGVSGVGPKMGIGILSALSGEELAHIVATADTKRLAACKGVGKKTAEKIILELHGKISAAEIMDAGEEPVAMAAKEPKLSKSDEDAVAALMGLGYKRAESVQAVARAKEQGAKSVEDIVLFALRGGI